MVVIPLEFSGDFVYGFDIDTEMNLSLLTANSLSKILESFKTSKYQEFPHVFLRDIAINNERVIKILRTYCFFRAVYAQTKQIKNR
jgi:hypothetical protein